MKFDCIKHDDDDDDDDDVVVVVVVVVVVHLSHFSCMAYCRCGGKSRDQSPRLWVL